MCCAVTSGPATHHVIILLITCRTNTQNPTTFSSDSWADPIIKTTFFPPPTPFYSITARVLLVTLPSLIHLQTLLFFSNHLIFFAQHCRDPIPPKSLIGKFCTLRSNARVNMLQIKSVSPHSYTFHLFSIWSFFHKRG